MDIFCALWMQNANDKQNKKSIYFCSDKKLFFIGVGIWTVWFYWLYLFWYGSSVIFQNCAPWWNESEFTSLYLFISFFALVLCNDVVDEPKSPSTNQSKSSKMLPFWNCGENNFAHLFWFIWIHFPIVIHLEKWYFLYLFVAQTTNQFNSLQ